MGALDAVVNSDLAKGIERDSIKLAIPVSVVRTWGDAMAKFVGRAKLALLENFSTHLKDAASECNVSEWLACFEKHTNEFKLQLAVEMLSDKKRPTSLAHNALFRFISSVNGAGRFLNVSPRLQDHEVTKMSVALAIQKLSNAAQCAVVIDGLQFIIRAEADPNVVSEVTAFLAKEKASDKNSDIPKSFWTELEYVKSNACCSVSLGPPTSVSSVPNGAGCDRTPPPKRSFSGFAKSESSKPRAPKSEVGASAKSGSSGDKVVEPSPSKRFKLQRPKLESK